MPPNTGSTERFACGSAAVSHAVESVEEAILEERREKTENHNSYIKNELQKESFCEKDDLGAYSTDSLDVLGRYGA